MFEHLLCANTYHAYGNVQINDNNQVYLNAENLLDENYETAGGFSTSSRAFYIGYKTEF